MPKFELEMELTGLKLRIKGDRGDVPVIAANVGQQIAGLLEPPANIVEGEPPRKTVEVVQLPPSPEAPSKNGHTRRRTAARNGNSAPTSTPVEFAHDSAKWGIPLQAWNPTNKSLWLLRIVEEQGGPKELSSSEIVATFNKFFKPSGKLRAPNVARDLGKIKTGAEALVVEDKSGSPIRWCLSHKGRAESDRLVAEARTGPAQPESPKL